MGMGSRPGGGWAARSTREAATLAAGESLGTTRTVRCSSAEPAAAARGEGTRRQAKAGVSRGAGAAARTLSLNAGARLERRCHCCSRRLQLEAAAAAAAAATAAAAAHRPAPAPPAPLPPLRTACRPRRSGARWRGPCGRSASSRCGVSVQGPAGARAGTAALPTLRSRLRSPRFRQRGQQSGSHLRCVMRWM